MARITIEDCIDKVDNRFDLVLKAAKRSREIVVNADEPLVEPEGDKCTVIALREIAAGYKVWERNEESANETIEQSTPATFTENTSFATHSETTGISFGQEDPQQA